MNPLHVVVLVIILILVLGGLPQLGVHSYGYYPSGLGFILFVVLIVLLLR